MQIPHISNRLAQINFHSQYLSGERQFYGAKLDRVNLSNKVFTEIDLREANIDYSILEKTSLSDSNLSESSLINASFKKSSLDNVMFNRVDLTNAKLSLCKITDVSFFGACLYKTSFCDATIDNVDFSFANLSAAYLARTDLSSSMFEGAIYNSNTAFPSKFDPVEAGMVHESEMFDIERILNKFDSLYQKAKHYLGDKITAEYFNSSRPEHDWLNKVKANNKNQIIFKGDAIKSYSYAEAEYLRQWMIVFANLCFKTFKEIESDREFIRGY